MRFSEALGHKVVSTSTAETVGTVAEFVIDPTAHAVVALGLKKTDHGDVLVWPDIIAFGADAVTVTGADKITVAGADVAALSGKDNHVLGKRVLSAAGDQLGTVDDVEFDPETGTVTALVLAGGPVAGVRLIGVGSYAVVVTTE